MTLVTWILRVDVMISSLSLNKLQSITCGGLNSETITLVTMRWHVIKRARYCLVQARCGIARINLTMESPTMRVRGMYVMNACLWSSSHYHRRLIINGEMTVLLLHPPSNRCPLTAEPFKCLARFNALVLSLYTAALLTSSLLYSNLKPPSP